MGIIVAGAAFVDIKGFPDGAYIPTGRNVGQVRYIHQHSKLCHVSDGIPAKRF